MGQIFRRKWMRLTVSDSTEKVVLVRVPLGSAATRNIDICVNDRGILFKLMSEVDENSTVFIDTHNGERSGGLEDGRVLLVANDGGIVVG